MIARVLPFALLTGLAIPALGADLDADGIPDDIEVQLGCRPGVDDGLVPVFEHEVYQETPEDAEGNAPDIARVHLGHIAEDRFLWKLEFAYDAQPPGAIIVLYVDADNDRDTGRQDKPEVRGTDVMYTARDGIFAASYHTPSYGVGKGLDARGAWRDNALFYCDDIHMARDGNDVPARARVLSQRGDGRGDSTPFHDVRIAANGTGGKPEIPVLGGPGCNGLTRAQVEPTDAAPPQRERPPVPFDIDGRAAGQPATVERERVTVTVQEESGIARTRAPLTFGMPFAEGVLFDPRQVRVLLGDMEVRAQVCPTSYWGDDSIRWALVDTLISIGANATMELTMEFGSEVTRTELPVRNEITATQDRIDVNTGGPARAILARGRPADLPGPGGAVLTDAEGKAYVSTVEELRVELAGPLKTIIRGEGPFVAEDGTELMRCIVRLTCWAESSTIDLAYTLVDDYLETEFVEIASLVLPTTLKGSAFAEVLAGDSTHRLALADGTGRLLQRDDRSYELTSGGEVVASGDRTGGAARVMGPGGVTSSVAVEDFWQRYPKALTCTDGGIAIEVLPDLTGETFFEDLPEHLAFPFVAGKYRFKWGMSTTERLRVAATGPRQLSPPLQELAAPRPVAVLPSEYYAKTGALGPMAPKVAGEFDAFDEAFAESFESVLAAKEAKREYGFFNWGDWHGERVRNWGNNEYDLAHALFMQFARTGDRRYYRLALAAARHQADVDCVHAYPDPHYIGANQLHSVCHTGEWSQNLRHPKWSYKYAYHTAATNGHTWSEGMCNAWYFAGDPRVMEAAIGLGEHIAWHMAPNFEELGTHERSAGWSLQAAMALYAATRDEAYLDAAKRIALVALREQKLDSTGAWPHPLPTDHAGGVEGAVGNVAFLVGVLMSGLADLHAEAPTPELERSLTAAAPWMAAQWRAERRDFQYTSSPGFAEGGSTAGLNGICARPLGYVYSLTGDKRYLALVAEAYVGLVRRPSGSFPKSFAQWSREAGDLMALLKSVEDPPPVVARAMSVDTTDLLLEDLATVGDSADFRWRGPDEKVFYLLSPGGERSVRAVRSLHGSKPKVDVNGAISLRAPDGSEVEAAEFNTDFPWEWEARIRAGSPAGVYTIVIDDDMRSVWDVAAEGCGRVIPVEQRAQMGSPGTRRYWFSVPEGADRLTVTAYGAHNGGYGGAVYDPEGELVHWAQGNASDTPGTRTVTLDVEPETPGMWSVVAWAAMDLGIRVEGVPPYVATGAEAWFDPTAP